jgi:hypothetical protein
MHKTLVAVVVVLALVSVTGAFANGQAEDATRTKLDDGFTRVSFGDVQVDWMVEGRDLRVRIAAPTTGWVAIGFEPSSAMKDANMIIGHVDGGNADVEDHFGTRRTAHASDESLGGSRDVTEVSGTEEDGQTTLRFTIPLDSGDEYDQPLSPGSTHTAIFAYGPDGADDYTTYHAARGSLEIDL